jgi:hypothetical protein
MAQLVGRLTALKVDRVKKPGMYADGGGLYLQVTGDGSDRTAKSWIYRFTRRGKVRRIGVGRMGRGDEPPAFEAPAMSTRYVRLGPGLVDEERALEVKLALARLPAHATSGDVGPTLLAGVQAFFEGDAFVLEEVPHRVVAHHNAAVGELGHQAPQCHIGPRRDPRQKPLPLTGKRIRPPPTH